MSELDIFTAAGEGLDLSHFGLMEDGTPYVIASKFAKALGYAKTQNATDQLELSERGYADVVTPGGVQRVGVILEDGIWELIFRSTLPSAKTLKAQVKAILRQLRETGAVDTGQRPMSELEMAQKYVAALERLEIAGPKAEAFDELMSAEGDYPMAVAAQILGLGQNTLFARLRDEHVLIAGGKRHNTPLQQYVKHFRVATSTYDDGEKAHVKYTTFVRPSGLDWIRKLLKLPAPIA
ncbi:phage antirepressor [Amycolatopsis sp. NPDC001319]|uniref:phage antirepressor n=1 Tax=unclassified Amycolatopsis TaxID=2618356 RepID=UPI00367CAA9A